jgi:hypothetical protein
MVCLGGTKKFLTSRKNALTDDGIVANAATAADVFRKNRLL